MDGHKSVVAFFTPGVGDLKWQFVTGGAVHSSTALGTNDTVYVGSYDRKSYALDGTSGASRREYQASGSLCSGMAIVADGTVYCASDGGGVAALDRATGQPRWQVQTCDHVLWSAPVLGMRGRLYVAASRIHALNGATGETVGEFTANAPVSSDGVATDRNGTVYDGVATGPGKVYALQGTSGLAAGAWP